MSSPQEYVPGTVGILLSSYQARLLREDGTEVDTFDEPGELLLSSPNQAAGYLGDDEGTAATFRNGWLRTGDVALFRKSPGGDAHLSIVDRLRDMIKVKVSLARPIVLVEKTRREKETLLATYLIFSTGTASIPHCHRGVSATTSRRCRRGRDRGPQRAGGRASQGVRRAVRTTETRRRRGLLRSVG